MIFCPWPYWLRIPFKQIYMANWFDTNAYNNSRLSGPGSNGSEWIRHTLHIIKSVIPGTPLFCVVYYFSAGDVLSIFSTRSTEWRDWCFGRCRATNSKMKKIKVGKQKKLKSDITYLDVGREETHNIIFSYQERLKYLFILASLESCNYFQMLSWFKRSNQVVQEILHRF